MPRKSVVRLTDRPNMILDVYHGRKTTQQTYYAKKILLLFVENFFSQFFQQIILRQLIL